MAEEERLELVTSFDQLRVGVVVVVKRCDWCGGGPHRGQLLGRFRWDDSPTGPVIRDDGAHEAFEVVPSPSSHEPLATFGISPTSVAQNKVYRVVDGLDPAADRERERLDEREMTARRRRAPLDQDLERDSRHGGTTSPWAR